VLGTFVSDATLPFQVRVAYDAQQEEKVFSINKRQVEPFSSVVGKFPIVICSPEHAPITMGGPAERRRFIDLVLSQHSESYFHHLLGFRKVLRHRNKILLDGKLSRRDVGGVLEPWNEQLASHGGYVMSRRMQFVREFQDFITTAYTQLVGNEEQPTIEYQPMSRIDHAETPEEMSALLLQDMAEREAEEKRVGSSLVGAHRDEFVLKINGLDLRKYASQGQHKTFLVALKIGEFEYLKDRCHETPIMLLDDIFSELDERRAGRLLQFIIPLSQTFITSTNPHLLENDLPQTGLNKTFTIQGGRILEQRPVMA
jgi:DNA replication and repair protein RecF